MCTILPCCNAQNWQRKVYLKVAPEDYQGEVLRVKKNTVFDTEEWKKNTNVQNPYDLGPRLVPKGTYVADVNSEEKKFFVVQEINGKHNRDSGFWGDSQGIVAFKAILATAVAFVPIYTLATMFLNLVRIPLNVLGTIKNIFKSMFNALYDQGVNEALFTLVRRSLVDLTVTLGNGIWSVLRCPLYGLAVQAAVIYAIFCPYEGRQIVGDLERAWHYPCTAHDDVKFKENISPMNGFDDFMKMLNTKVMFCFFCYQASGSWENERDEEGNKKYISLDKV